MDTTQSYNQATVKTANDLRTVAGSQLLRDLSHLSLPEIDAVVELVSRIVPAGNVPGVILSGLARLPERRPPLKITRRDINLLFKGVEQALDHAVYGALFAGPAAVIWGYQNLLRLAGKDPDDSFPEGTWQFYVDYALREDTARHTNETHGFDTVLNQHDIRLSAVDRITAWAMAAIHCLHQYDGLLENEWRERVYTAVLTDLTRGEADAERHARAYREWQAQRPYGRGPDASPDERYPAYRKRKFDLFLSSFVDTLRDDLKRAWAERVRTAEAEDLPAYQRQMTILAYLDPGPYGEARIPIPVSHTHIGLIHRGHYHLIPTWVPGTDQLADGHTVRAEIATLAAASLDAPAASLAPLARSKRASLANLRSKFSTGLLAELDALRFAPVLLNCDPRPRRMPLAELRQAERGIGSQALTLFDTGETMVFDQSHVFFDGAWGAALAEILTNEALAWAVYLHSLPPPQPTGARPRRLTFSFRPSELEAIHQSPQAMAETAAETDAVNLNAIMALRKLFKRRNDLLQFTVNDLLVLYRAIHAITYQPDPELVAELKTLANASATRQAALAALAAHEESRDVNPAILIPLDASQRSPRERLFPFSFEVPFKELELLSLHEQVINALNAYQSAPGERAAIYAEFDRLQRTYLAMLAGFGRVLGKAKEIAIRGESASVGTIKLLAHMPTPIQRLLDAVPHRVEVLNDLIKGREVFSNVGAVAKSSTLTRFITAKDDNEKKMLAWGVLTDADGLMRITLRDFRPHVGLLVDAGHKAMAARLTQHYLDAYAHGLNRFIRDLQRITIASRATRAGRQSDDR